MITSSDREYKSTKRIKQGKKGLHAPFDELAEWVSETRNVTVLNVIYDRRNSLHAPRIQVILEHQSQAQKFHSGVNLTANNKTRLRTRNHRTRRQARI